MLDALVLPYPAPRADAWAGYIKSPGMSSWWTLDDWQRARAAARWLLPIAGYSPASASPGNDAYAQRAEISLYLGGHHMARMLDVEQDVAESAARNRYPWAWAQAVAGAGDYPIIYCSGASAHLFVGLNLCVAEWNNTPHLAPGSVATQYASPVTDHALDVDISVVTDGVPLLDTGAPPAMPTNVFSTEDERVYYKPGQPDRDDWRPVAVQVINGALFVFNATANPFHEGTLEPFGGAHVLDVGLVAGERFTGLSDRSPSGAVIPDGLDALSILPDGEGARHALHWA